MSNTTRPIVPRVDGDSSVGVPDKHWGNGYFDAMHVGGLGDLEGNQKNVYKHLAESTGYGIVSGCTPSIAGLTVTVASGIVHLADGTRKEISASTVTLDAADATNPRIDLVYITSAGAVAKVTGTAAASPVVPSGGISVAQVSVAANASTGTIADMRKIAWQAKDEVKVITVKNAYNIQGDCIIIETKDNTMMIDTGSATAENLNNIINSLTNNNIDKVDYLLLSHYHGDHYGNLQGISTSQSLLSLPQFEETRILLPDPTNRATTLQSAVTGMYNQIISVINTYNNDYEILSQDKTFYLSDNVKIDLLCCNPSLRAYLADKATDENEYSVLCKLTHNNINMLFTGDSEGYEIPYIVDNYDLCKMDIYKANHHGVRVMPVNDNETGHIWKYANMVSPTYVLVPANRGWLDAGDKFYNDQQQTLTKIFSNIGSEMLYAWEDIIFYSNGHNVKNESCHKFVKNDSSGDGDVHIFINNSYSGEDSDGTAAKPYRSINAAFARVKNNQNGSKFSFHIASGTYNNFIIKNWQVSSAFVFDENVTINYLYLDEVNRVNWTGGTVTVKNMNISYSRVEFKNSIIIDCSARESTGAIKNRIYLSETYFTNLKYIGNLNGSGWELGVLFSGGKNYIQNFEVETTKDGAVQVSEGGILIIRELSVSNVMSFASLTGVQTNILVVKKYGTITNFGKFFSNINSDSYGLANTPDMKNNYGDSSNRPTAGNVPVGHMYYDTTLGHMLIWTGSKWHDCTTNADL